MVTSEGEKCLTWCLVVGVYEDGGQKCDLGRRSLRVQEGRGVLFVPSNRLSARAGIEPNETRILREDTVKGMDAMARTAQLRGGEEAKGEERIEVEEWTRGSSDVIDAGCRAVIPQRTHQRRRHVAD